MVGEGFHGDSGVGTDLGLVDLGPNAVTFALVAGSGP